MPTFENTGRNVVGLDTMTIEELKALCAPELSPLEELTTEQLRALCARLEAEIAARQ